jgi:uncharacterized OB-fold protein
VGPRTRGHQAPAGSPDLTADGPLDLDEDPPRLVAGRCGGCGALTFPLRAQCPACGGAVERTLLPARGTLWTWTTQGFEPPRPPYVPEEGEFQPFGVGYVEFEGFLRVEGRLTETEPERLRIGMPMEVVPLERGGRVTYAFAPADDR